MAGELCPDWLYELDTTKAEIYFVFTLALFA